MRRPRYAVLRRLMLASTAAVASACTTTRVERGPVRVALPATGRKGEIRLSVKNGPDVHLFYPRLEGDSVLGWSVPDSDAPRYRVAVAKDDVTSVAVRRGNTFKTVLAVTAGTYAALGLIALTVCASSTTSY